MNLPKDVEAIADRISSFFKLPFASDTIPGGFAEALIADHYGGEVLATYDFVDVICAKKQIGWQIKSTKAATPVTWKRAKIEGSAALIRDSDLRGDTEILGTKIIETCNEHAQESFNKYDLMEIRYARIISSSDRFTYFEKPLIDKNNQFLFDPSDYTWKWAKPKRGKSKEQLPALNGFRNQEKWFAWHGRGENQLHFTGEKNWWPSVDFSVASATRMKPAQRRTWPELIDWLSENT